MNLSERKRIERAVMADADRECTYGMRQPCVHPNCLAEDFDKKARQWGMNHFASNETNRHSEYYNFPQESPKGLPLQQALDEYTQENCKWDDIEYLIACGLRYGNVSEPSHLHCLAHSMAVKLQALQVSNQASIDALNSVLSVDLRGHELQDRLQFTESGRALLEKAQNARTLHESNTKASFSSL